MKKAFLFSVIFVLLFTVLLIFSVFYINMLQMNELNLAQARNITKVAYAMDDVRSDMLDYLQLSVNISSNSTNTILSISDVLPSPYGNPANELSNYRSFINGTYANQTNLINSSNISVISLNTTAFESAPSIQFINSNSSLNLNYSYTNLSKNELIVNGSTLLTNYSISITLNSSCLNSNCSNATWAGGPPNVDSSTLGLWHFDEGSGSYAYDSSGNGNTCTFAANTWTTGRFGGGASPVFGQSFYVSDSSSLDRVGSHTIELWFKITTFGITYYLVSKDTIGGVTTTDYSISIDSSTNKIRGTVANGTSSAFVLSTNPVQANTWYHVAFVVNGTNLTLYTNGVLDNITSETVTPLPNSNKLYLGSPYGGGLPFPGTIDELAIYSRAKSADEIAADANLFHWDWSPIAMTNNLSAAWHFDEGSGNLTYDSSANNNTGGFTGTQIAVLLPSSVNKAYGINSTSTDNPFIATTELNYSNVNASDGISETVNASYTNTWGSSCQASGSCSCAGDSGDCFAPGVCENIAGCIASCSSAVNASVSNTCAAAGSDCALSCPEGCQG